MSETPALPDRRRLLLGAGAAAFGAALTLRSAAAALQEISVGAVLPDTSLDGLNGPRRQLLEYRGRPLLINVWASWCQPCIQEMSSLERLSWLDERPAFTLIGISTDDYRDRALAFLKKTNASFTHYLDHNVEMETRLGAQHIPLTVVVDAQGRVRRKQVGSRRWDAPDAVAWIAQALGTGAL
jgi:peroxiredoxin